jgi:hypothetical protein
LPAAKRGGDPVGCVGGQRSGRVREAVTYTYPIAAVEDVLAEIERGYVEGPT